MTCQLRFVQIVRSYDVATHSAIGRASSYRPSGCVRVFMEAQVRLRLTREPSASLRLNE